MDNTPFIPQQPNDLETVFANQAMTNPYAMLLAGSAGLARRNDINQYNQATADTMQNVLGQQARLKQAEIAGEITKSLIGQTAGLPVALQQLGVDPSGAQALQDSIIQENKSKVFNNAGSGAKALMDAGVQTGVDGLSQFGVNGQNVEPLDLQKARIAGQYQVEAAKQGERARNPLLRTTVSGLNAEGQTVQRRIYDGEEQPDAPTIGITSGAPAEDQYLINNYAAAAANELKRQGKNADPRGAQIVRRNGQVFIQMPLAEGGVGLVPLNNAQ